MEQKRKGRRKLISGLDIGLCSCCYELLAYINLNCYGVVDKVKKLAHNGIATGFILLAFRQTSDMLLLCDTAEFFFSF
jgi:hypothetical protein